MKGYTFIRFIKIYLGYVLTQYHLKGCIHYNSIILIYHFQCMYPKCRKPTDVVSYREIGTGYSAHSLNLNSRTSKMVISWAKFFGTKRMMAVFQILSCFDPGSPPSCIALLSSPNLNYSSCAFMNYFLSTSIPSFLSLCAIK